MSETGNRLLDRLPETEYERLRPHLERQSFAIGAILDMEDEPVRWQRFPIAGMIVSMVNVMEDGGTVEVLLAGHESVAAHSLFGRPEAPWRAVVQVAGDALTCERALLVEQMPSMPVFESLMKRQTNFMMRFAAQSVGCNRFHELSERAARWLLLVHDRADSDTLGLTQDFLSQMLGVHRPSVTVAMGLLQEAGLIERIGRGSVAIRDRHGLENASCECYRRIREYESLLGAAESARTLDS